MLLCLLPWQPYVLCSKRLFFPLPKWEGKKSYLKTYLERNNLAFLKAGISLHLIKSHSLKNVKSKRTNFLINPFIYFSGIAFWLYFVCSRTPVLFPYHIHPHYSSKSTTAISILWNCCYTVISKNEFSIFQWLYLLISMEQISCHLYIRHSVRLL